MGSVSAGSKDFSRISRRVLGPSTSTCSRRLTVLGRWSRDDRRVDAPSSRTRQVLSEIDRSSICYPHPWCGCLGLAWPGRNQCTWGKLSRPRRCDRRWHRPRTVLVANYAHLHTECCCRAKRISLRMTNGELRSIEEEVDRLSASTVLRDLTRRTRRVEDSSPMGSIAKYQVPSSMYPDGPVV